MNQIYQPIFEEIEAYTKTMNIPFKNISDVYYCEELNLFTTDSHEAYDTLVIETWVEGKIITERQELNCCQWTLLHLPRTENISGWFQPKSEHTYFFYQTKWHQYTPNTGDR